MTGRSRWLIVLCVAGLGLGLFRLQLPLSLLSLSVLLWLFFEWVVFHLRLLFEVPALKVTRVVNGRTSGSNYLRVGRPATVEVSLQATGVMAVMRPLLFVRDCLPENAELTAGCNEVCILRREKEFILRYTLTPRSVGRLLLAGFRITVMDPQKFFAAQRFLSVEQEFRVLPVYAETGDQLPLVKRINSLPLHGIHRLQRAGLGSELLELREYVPGDPPKSIAWKVSARREQLMTRQYESEVPVRVHLFVDGSISTRAGGYGSRLLDQMLYVAATVARLSLNVGDPVGSVLFDERGSRVIRPVTGERGFYQLLEAFSDFGENPPPPRDRLTPELLNAALTLAGERCPELLDPHINRVPFTFLPLLPWKRQAFYRRSLLAGILAQRFHLTALQQIALAHDDGLMAQYTTQFLAGAGVAWMAPLVQTRSRGFHNGLATMELLSKALVDAVGRARDNEVYVIIANLLECATNISQVLPAVRMALARHHRVVFVCPSPSLKRPEPLPPTTNKSTAEDLLERAEQLRILELSERLKRTLRRVGASVSLSGEEAAIRLVLSEAGLARTGRISTRAVK